MKWLLAMLMLSTLAHAGQGGGNGGGSVVCRNEKGHIVKAELLDIYEGKSLYKRSYDRNLSVQEAFKRVETRLDAWPNFKVLYLDQLKFIEENLIFVDEKDILSRTDDIVITVMEKDCKYEQLANYTDIGEIFVNEELYSYLTEINQAALIVHEAIYAIFRTKTNYKEKVMDARRITAQLIAEEMNTTLVGNVMARFEEAK